MSLDPKAGNPFPAEKQQLILQAALLSGPKMHDAWEAWRSKVDLETDIEYASFRVLPLLYHNLHNKGIDNPLMPRLKGIYRQSWSKNHILFYRTGKVLQLINSAGIPTLVLKGIALTILTYKNYSVRPMSDMDILVPVAQARKTIELLKANGWVSMHPDKDEYFLKYGNSVTFIDEAKTELDLHWYPFVETYGLMEENDFWDHAEPLKVAGVPTLALCASDELLLTIVHGLMYNPEPPIRWISDAIVLLGDNDRDVDFDRLLFYAKKFRVVIQLKEAFQYLIEHFQASVPTDFLRHLAKIKPSFAEKVVYRHAKKKGVVVYFPTGEKLFSIYAEYLSQTKRSGFVSQQIGFIKHMRQRTKSKPYHRIFIYYLSQLFRKPKAGGLHK